MIRPATEADVPELARLRWEFRVEFGAPAEPEAEFLDRCRGWMQERLGPQSRWRCWIAQEGGRPVGTIWLQAIEKLPNPVSEPELHGYVSSLYVDPAARGRGTGSALLAACLETCDLLGMDAVILWPTPESRALYARHGFAVREDLLERRGGARHG
jgi:GNAT superfamily N-acetyltransferase